MHIKMKAKNLTFCIASAAGMDTSTMWNEMQVNRSTDLWNLQAYSYY